MAYCENCAKAEAEVERLARELHDATINADEGDEIAAELFELCCAVVDGKPDAAAARDSLQKHIEHVQSCRLGACNTELGHTPLRAANERLTAALREIAENYCNEWADLDEIVRAALEGE